MSAARPSLVDRLPRLTSWMKEEGPYGRVALTSRVRLARNLADAPFPWRASEEELRAVERRIRELRQQEPALAEFEYWRLEDPSPAERWGLAERYITSLQHISDPVGRALLFDRRECLSILVNEEDHLRLQCIFPGLQLETAWHVAEQMESLLERRLPLAFDPQWGYLTACPSNVGAGLRASVMVHLPGLCLLEQLEETFQEISAKGMTVRGFHGEGSAGPSAIHQVSNQITLGVTEEDLISRLTQIIVDLAEREMRARSEIRRTRRTEMLDRVARSLGVLRYARSIDSQEALELLSWVRYGADEGFVEGLDHQTFNELWVWVQPGAQQMAAHRELPAAERDLVRARMLRHRLQAAKLVD